MCTSVKEMEGAKVECQQICMCRREGQATDNGGVECTWECRNLELLGARHGGWGSMHTVASG